MDGGIMSDTPLLKVDEIQVNFGAVKALDRVSFDVLPRTIHAVIGPNGAGKSTLLNVLSGVYRAQKGSVKFDNNELTRMRPHQITSLGIGRAFQNLALSGKQTVFDNLMLGRQSLTKSGFLACGLWTPSARKEERDHRERVVEIADFLGLIDDLENPVGELSYGAQKRVEIARALAIEPRFLLLDEPVAGMNAGEKRNISIILRKIIETLDLTILLVEHDMEVVMALSDQVTVLDFGRTIANGPPNEVQNDPAVIAAYLGTPMEVQQ